MERTGLGWPAWRRAHLRAGIAVLAVAVLVPLAVAVRPAGEPSSADAPASAATAADGPRLSAARTETRTIASRTLGRTLPYQIFLPPGYDAEPERRYPVLYMLHGLGGDHTEWAGYGLFEQAERLMRVGAIAPTLIVLPEGDGSYWMDHADGGPRWGAYVADDLVREIDGRYRTLAGRAHRAIGGNSMGAHGALQLSLNYPEVFGVTGAHSPTLRRRDTMPTYAGDDAHFEKHDPVTLVKRRPEAARSLRLWLDVGSGDYWTGTIAAFHAQLQDAGVPHQFDIYPGAHEDAYWTTNIPRYLRFYTEAME